MSIGTELVSSIVGPMPVQEFLDEFLPIAHIPHYSQPCQCFWKNQTFNKTVKAKDELKMYQPFVRKIHASSAILLTCPS